MTNRRSKRHTMTAPEALASILELFPAEHACLAEHLFVQEQHIRRLTDRLDYPLWMGAA